MKLQSYSISSRENLAISNVLIFSLAVDKINLNSFQLCLLIPTAILIFSRFSSGKNWAFLFYPMLLSQTLCFSSLGSNYAISTLNSCLSQSFAYLWVVRFINNYKYYHFIRGQLGTNDAKKHNTIKAIRHLSYPGWIENETYEKTEAKTEENGQERQNDLKHANSLIEVNAMS